MEKNIFEVSDATLYQSTHGKKLFLKFLMPHYISQHVEKNIFEVSDATLYQSTDGKKYFRSF